jgi:predicted 2-oxoglutarate/Fe(II)-dependent dioxygenase YbiX
MSYISKSQVSPGIWIYKGSIKESIINDVEDIISRYPNDADWTEALVGYAAKAPKEYRDCLDFKIQAWPQEHVVGNPFLEERNALWQKAHDMQIDAVEDYCRMYNIKMDYWEAMNFVKYGPEQHFAEHADHGFSYVATVSIVSYPNEGYTGGELYFPKLDITIKPEAGDQVIFPSTYLFSHKSMPVIEGTKYSIVTMLDYNDNSHSREHAEHVAKANSNV